MSVQQEPDREAYALLFPDVAIWGAERDIAPLHREDMALYELSPSVLRRVEAARGDHATIRAIITYEATVYSGFDGPTHPPGGEP